MGYRVIFITGVSGSGKTTVGSLLAGSLHCPFADGDDFHPRENIRKMQSGIPLQDKDRWPWLEALNRYVRETLKTSSLVVACSALKESYRQALTEGLQTEDCFWVHLTGTYDTIYARLSARKGHFMSPAMLQSQFSAREQPREGLILDVGIPAEQLVRIILENMENKLSELGLVGLGVMGKSLARNLSRNGVRLSLYNRRVPGKEEDVAAQCVAGFSELAGALPFEELPAFVASLARPRKILLMVNAGPAVDDVINALLPLLDAGDVLVDGGNSHYSDTRRRLELLKARDIGFLGTGVSGGEEGALWGPAIMPGGSETAYEMMATFLTRIAAKDKEGQACCTYIGPEGAGHFVKMVHNGIEYAEMQLLAEVYSLLRRDMGLNPDEIADILADWQQTGLRSYLLGITVDILRFREPGGEWLLDKILDKAGNKGTGGWTTIAACELGVPVPVLTAALFARYQSAFKAERVALNGVYAPSAVRLELPVDQIRDAYAFARIINHYQGLQLIREASRQHHWNINLPELARIWTNGCIIRSELMQQAVGWLQTSPDLLTHPDVVRYLKEALPNTETTLAALISGTQAYPCLLAALAYFKGAILSDSGANLLQAQRDYFGAHTYERSDDPSGRKYHTHWTEKP